MKILLLSILIPFISLSQITNKFKTYDLDSIVRSNFSKIVYETKKNKKFKITNNFRLNREFFSNDLKNLDFKDYLNIGTYDYRIQYFITPNFEISQQIFIFRGNTIYTSGIILKLN